MRALLFIFAWAVSAAAAPADDLPTIPAPPPAVVDGAAGDVAVVYTEQGCIGESASSLGLFGPLVEHFQATPGAVRPERVAFSPLRLDDVIVMPGASCANCFASDQRRPMSSSC